MRTESDLNRVTSPLQDPSIARELMLVMQEHRAGDLNSAQARIARLLKTHPNHADVHMAQAMVLVAQGDRTGALRWLTSSLEMNPNNPEALGWSASLLNALGRYSETEQFARRLINLMPSHPRGYELLAEAKFEQNQLDEALESIERGLALHSASADAWTLRARILIRLRLPSVAIESYRRSLAIRPTPPAAIDLSRILLRENHPEEALEILQNLASSQPESQRPHALIAQAHTEMRQFDLAEDHWQLAEKHASDKGKIIQKRASAEIAAGRFSVAVSILTDAIDRKLAPAENFCLLATAQKMTGADVPLIERAQQLLKGPEISASNSMRLNFALGKSFDDLGDYERAIRYYDEANRISFELYPARQKFNREETTGFIDFLTSFFSAERIAELSRSGTDSKLPLFVVGMIRSGTTLTENILSAHSQIAAGGEQMFWTQHAAEFFRWTAAGLELDYPRVLGLSPSYLSLLGSQSANVLRVVDKNPFNFHLASLLTCVYPEAKIIHVKRHPVDNLLSMWMTPMSEDVGYASNRENLVFFYREYLRLFEHLRQVLPKDRFATFEYEHITSEPQKTITAIFDHIGLTPEPACFSPEKNLRTVLTPSVYQVRQPIHSGSQGRWKHYQPWLGPFEELA